MSLFITDKVGVAIIVIALWSLTDRGVAGPERYLRRGYIQSDTGKKCWYTQKTDPDSTHFHGTMKGTVGIMTFDDPQCMSDSGVGLDTNMMMINNIISRWYSQPDARFRTRVPEMRKGSLLQKKGRCIQSATYPAVGIAVDYLIRNKSITAVIHGSTVQGCTD